MAEVRQAVAGHAADRRGAVRAVREGSASLLPVGVVEVLGDFDAGDAVEIAEGQAEFGEQGRTLARESATTPRRSCGRCSA